MKIKDWFLITLYLIACLALFPILQFEYFRSTEKIEQVSEFFYWFRIFFSGPFLILIGILLVWKTTKFHRIIGLLSLMIGIYWAIKVISDIVAEIRIF